MVEVDLKRLVGRLNQFCTRALEGAAGNCVSRTNYEVTVEHLLQALMDDPNTDIQQILQKFEIDPGRLPLSPGVDAPRLPEMEAQEAHRVDLWGTGISTRHPIEFIRPEMEERGCLTVQAVLELRRPSFVEVAGVVTHRQRPATASGVIFFNLEDETGQLNVIVLPAVWERYRMVARRASALVIEGRVEHRHGVTNLVARHMEPLGVYSMQSRDFR